MTDNKPAFLHHFSWLDNFGGLLLFPKKQTGECFEHCCCSLSSLQVSGFTVVLLPLFAQQETRVLQESFATEDKNKPAHRVSSYNSIFSSSNSNPPVGCLGACGVMRLPSSDYFSKFKQCLVSWHGCPMKCLVYCSVNNYAHSPRISLLGSICFHVHGGGALSWWCKAWCTPPTGLTWLSLR